MARRPKRPVVAPSSPSDAFSVRPWVAEFLDRYDALDAALVASGFPPTSPWWRSRIARFLRSGKSRWVLRVGRRGGKSSTLSRLLVAWVLWGPWTIPPGDTAMVAIISVDRDEASKRMVTIEAILSVAGVTFERKAQAQEIHIPERRAAFAVKTCSLTGTVGFTSIAIFCDEQAKWASKEESANPAGTVMATLRPTMATQPLAFEIDCSAPWGTDDYHAKLCAEGDTSAQNYDHAATWDANPSPETTEERLRALEPDQREFTRAYAAIPSSEIAGAWFGLALEKALEKERCAEDSLEWVRYTVSLDVDLVRERLSYSVVSSRTLPPDPREPTRNLRVTRVHETGLWELDGKPVREVAFKLREGVLPRYPKARLITDDEGRAFAMTARQAGLNIEVIPWTTGRGESTELERYRLVRTEMREGTLLFPSEPGLFADLRAVRARKTATGNELIELPRVRKEKDQAGPFCRSAALVLGVSTVLLHGPQAERVEKTPESEQATLRAAAVKEIVDKRRKEWQTNKTGVMRKALGI